jgi:putative transcriptional regulator
MMSAQEINAPRIGPGAMTVRLRIDELLREKGKSAYWLANETGIANSTLSKMRTGKTKGIDFESIDAICRVLECEPGELFVRADDKKGGRKG